MKLRQLLVVSVPACLAAGWAGAHAVGAVQAQNAAAVLTTFKAKPSQAVSFPAPGNYWVFGAAAQDVIKQAEGWTISATHDSTHVAATVSRPDSRRAKGRANRSALDLLFILRIAEPGPYTLRLTPEDHSPGDVSLRINRFSAANAGAAMRAFGLAVLFSALLVANAIIWFRGAPSR